MRIDESYDKKMVRIKTKVLSVVWLHRKIPPAAFWP